MALPPRGRTARWWADSARGKPTLRLNARWGTRDARALVTATRALALAPNEMGRDRPPWHYGGRGPGGLGDLGRFSSLARVTASPPAHPRGPAPREGVQKGPMVPKAARYPFKALTAQSEFEVPDGCRSIKRGASPAGRRCWERAKVVRGSHRPSLRWQAGVGHGPRNSTFPGWARCLGTGRR